MSKRAKRKQSLLVKYAILFQISLLVPLLVVSIFFVPESSKLLRERVLTDKRAELSVYSDGLNRQIDSIFSCANRLSTSENIYSYRLLRPEVYGNLIIRDIRTNVFSSALVNDIYIVSPSLPFAYSSFSTYSFERLADRLTDGKMSSGEYEAFLKTLDGERQTVIYGDDLILLYYHFPVLDTSADTYLIFEITQQMLSNYLRDFPQNYHFSIITDNDAVIYKTGREVTPPDFVYTEHHPVLNWTFKFTIPAEDFERVARGFRMTAYSLLFAVVLLGGALVSGFAYISYRPLKKLKNDLEALIGQGKGISGGDELQVVRQIALDLYGSAQALIGKGRDAYKNFIILRLIHGVTADYHAEKQQLTELGMFVETEYCFAVVIYFDYFDADGSPDAYAAFWEEFAERNEKTAYAVFGSQPRQIIALIFGDSEQADAYIPFLEKARDAFAETYGLPVTVGVGLVYPDIESVSLSYMQAIMAYEYRSVLDHGRVLLFDPVNTVPTDCGKAFGDALDAFHKAAAEHSTTGIFAATERIVDYVSDTRLTVYAARAACHYLAQTVSMMLYDLPYPVENTMQYGLAALDAAETPQGFVSFVRNLGESLSARILACEREHPEPEHAVRQALSRQITDYIEKNFVSNQMSVALVAKQFGISTSYVSRVFREEQGKTILEYLTERRIAYACELLRQTDKSIETIVMEIGYFDASSFIRKFKRVTGVTPGEYRKRAPR